MRLATLTASLLTASALTLVACGGGDHDHAEGGHSHAHAAQYGGTLVELGDHVAHVELVLDTEAGRLRLYSMDAHAEQPVRLSDPGIDVVVELADGSATLTLEPVASELTGETAGDTSEFAVTDPRLVGLAELEGRIPTFTTRGRTFEDVAFPPQ